MLLMQKCGYLLKSVVLLLFVISYSSSENITDKATTLAPTSPCVVENNTAVCSDIENFDSLTDVRITDLVVRSQKLKKIQKNDLAKFVDLKTIDISDSGLTEIDPEAFGTLTNLEKINLSGNTKLKIPATFIHSKTVTHLNLSEVPIGHSAEKIFNEVPNLKVLDLTATNFQDLAPITILKSLTTLVISKDDYYNTTIICDQKNLHTVLMRMEDGQEEVIICEKQANTKNAEVKVEGTKDVKIEAMNAEDKKSDEKKAEKKLADEKEADQKEPDEKKPDEKKPEEKKPDEKKPDEKKPDVKKVEEKKEEGNKSEKITPVISDSNATHVTEKAVPAVKSESIEEKDNKTSEAVPTSATAEKKDDAAVMETITPTQHHHQEEGIEEQTVTAKIDPTSTNISVHRAKKIEVVPPAVAPADTEVIPDVGINPENKDMSHDSVEDKGKLDLASTIETADSSGTNIILGIVICVMIVGALGFGYRYYKNRRSGYRQTSTRDHVDDGKELQTIVAHHVDPEQN